MRALLLLPILLVACRSKPIENKQAADTATIPSKAKSVKVKNTVPRSYEASSFADFESLVESEKDIGINTIRKFVQLKDSTLLKDSSSFTGRSTKEERNFKTFCFLQGDWHKAHYIYVTYNYSNQQIDSKSFQYSCRDCPKDQLFAFVFYANYEKNSDIKVQYFIPQHPEMMPDPEREKIIREELWHLTAKGKFVLTTTR